MVHAVLVKLGLAPHLLSDTLIDSLFGIVEEHIARADLSAMRPTVNWRSTANHRQPTPLTRLPRVLDADCCKQGAD